MRPDRLSELFKGNLSEIIKHVGPNETLIVRELAEKEGISVTRHTHITFWQALLACSWFPILLAFLTVYIWSKDENKVVVQYVYGHWAITATGIFAGWLLATALTVYLFRYVRNS